MASPMAWPALAQALVVEKLGPIAPKLMDTWPAAMLAMAMGMKNGLTRSAPRSWLTMIWSMRVPVPPRPEPMTMPVWSASSPSSFAGRPAWSMAWRVATSAIWVVRSLRRISLRSSTVEGSKSSTSPAMVQGTRDASKLAMVRTPDSPATSRVQNSSTLVPSGVTAPMPVTTTRRDRLIARTSRCGWWRPGRRRPRARER